MNSPQLCMFVVLASCYWLWCDVAESIAAEPLVLAGPTMGSTYSIHLAELPADISPSQLHREIEALLEEFGATFSTYRHDSELLRIHDQPAKEWIVVSPRMFTLLQSARRLSEETDGAFDITVAPLVELWKRADNHAEPSAAEIAAAMELVGNQRWQLQNDPAAVRKSNVGVKFDVNGIVPGYAIDCVAELLQRNHVQNYLIELGGEILAKGVRAANEDWAVGLESPTLQQEVEKRGITIALRNQAVATSGDYRQLRLVNRQKMSHIVNPLNGRLVPYRELAVSVFAADCLTADAWATAYAVWGPEQGLLRANQNQAAVCFQIAQPVTGEVRVLASQAFEQQFTLPNLDRTTEQSSPVPMRWSSALQPWWMCGVLCAGITVWYCMFRRRAKLL
jgi:FAD:protein FMN transferase